MRVIYIKPAKSKGYLCIGLARGEEKQCMYISESAYTDIGAIRVGDELDGERLSLLKEEDGQYRASMYALRILSFSDNNEKTLFAKLLRRGIPRDIAQRTVREMVGRGYINEQKQLERLIQSEVNDKLTGPQKLYAKLMAKGYARSDIECALDALVASQAVDFERSAELLIEKKLTRGATEDEKQKLLYKNGYGIC